METSTRCIIFFSLDRPESKYYCTKKKIWIGSISHSNFACKMQLQLGKGEEEEAEETKKCGVSLCGLARFHLKYKMSTKKNEKSKQKGNLLKTLARFHYLTANVKKKRNLHFQMDKKNVLLCKKFTEVFLDLKFPSKITCP